jgi:urease gamma subunit
MLPQVIYYHKAIYYRQQVSPLFSALRRLRRFSLNLRYCRRKYVIQIYFLSLPREQEIHLYTLNFSLFITLLSQPKIFFASKVKLDESGLSVIYCYTLFENAVEGQALSEMDAFATPLIFDEQCMKQIQNIIDPCTVTQNFHLERVMNSV